jgi:hypothetical protein
LGIPTEDLQSIASILATGYLRHRDQLRRAASRLDCSEASSAHGKLLRAHSLLEAFGLHLLPIPDAKTRMADELRTHTKSLPAARATPRPGPLPERFDVAVSFAGTERQYAEPLAKTVRWTQARGVNPHGDPHSAGGSSLTQ